MEKKKTPIFYGRPKDDSFEAYFEFINALSDKLGAKKTATKEDIRASWERIQAKKSGKKGKKSDK